MSINVIGGGGGGAEQYPDYLCRQDIPDGTAGDPFTDIRQIYGLGLDGQYFFNFGGGSFETYVTGDSALVLRYDDALFTDTANGLAETLALTSTEAGGVIDRNVIGGFANADGVALKMYNGNGTHVDAVSSDARYVEQIAAFESLFPGTSTSPTTLYETTDFIAMSDTWTGTGDADLSSPAPTIATTTDLDLTVFHSAGNQNKVIAASRRLYHFRAGNKLTLNKIP